MAQLIFVSAGLLPPPYRCHVHTAAPPANPACRPFNTAFQQHKRISVLNAQTSAARQGVLCTAGGASVGASPVLTQPSGSSINLHKDAFTVGTAAAADIRIEGGNCEAEHALIERKSGRVFCTALVGDADDLLSDTYTWLGANQLRKGVAYLVAPGSSLAFGDPEQKHVLEFEEQSNASPALELVMRGMAAGGSNEVQKRLDS